RNRGNTATSGNRHWRPVNGLDQHSSQTPEQRCYHQKNRSEEALLHSCWAHNLAASETSRTADCAVINSCLRFPESKAHPRCISPCRDLALMEKLLQDVRFGFRQLIKQPGFAALAIISMALGIGANTSIFSLVDTVLLRPLAVKEPSQLVELYGTIHNGAEWSLQSYPNYKDYRDRNTVFSGLFVYRVVVSSLTVNKSSQRVWGYLVSGNYFDVLGVKPALGRGSLPEDDQTPDSHPVAVIGYNCWQRRFGGDPAVVGKTVQFNSRPFTVIGVTPKGFIGTEVAYDPEMFVPVMMAKTIEPGSTWLDKRDSNNLFTVGRLKPGLSF